MATIIQLTRLLLVIRKIKSRTFGYITLKELHDHINENLLLRGYNEISQRSLERDIENIRKPPFGLNIQYASAKGYQLMQSNYDGVDVEQLLEPFDILNALQVDTGLSDFILIEKYRNKGTELLHKLIIAIRENFRISFSYSKYLSEDFSERILEPYAIKLFNGQWYIVGKTATSNDIKTFGLDRMSSLNISRQKFKRDNSVDLNEKFKYSFGIYSSDEYPVENVILSFDYEDGQYLKTVPLHSSQEVVNQTEKEIIIKLKVRITEDFVMAILSRSWSLEVIEPASLRKRVCHIYKSALERNLWSISLE